MFRRIVIFTIIFYCSKCFAGERTNFTLSSAYFVSSELAFNYAYHDGARQCVLEFNRVHQSPNEYLQHHGVNSGKVIIPNMAILGTSLILELSHKQRLAKRILLFGGTAQYGMAVSTYWAGCN